MDRDYVMALRLQEQELHGRLMNRTTAHRVQHNNHAGSVTFHEVHQMSTAEAKRIAYCLNLLWLITGLHLAVFLASLGLSDWKVGLLWNSLLMGGVEISGHFTGANALPSRWLFLHKPVC